MSARPVGPTMDPTTRRHVRAWAAVLVAGLGLSTWAGAAPSVGAGPAGADQPAPVISDVSALAGASYADVPRPGVVPPAESLPRWDARADRRATAAARDLVAHPGVLRSVPQTYRPKVRWWWPVGDVDRAELRTELTAIKRAGFGGVEQVLLYHPNDWATPAFRDDLLFALRTATSLGLTFDVTLGPAWPVSAPAVSDVSDEASMQDLNYGSVDVVGPVPYVGPVPDLPTLSTSLHRRLVGVVAARVVSQSGTATVLDPSTAVDLTRTVSGGLISWTPPTAGQWKLYGLWMRPTMQTNKGGGLEGPLVADHYGRRGTSLALADFDRLVFSHARAAFRANGGDVFEDSYEVTHGGQLPLPVPVSTKTQSGVFWTRDMRAEFRARRGYDLATLMPGLFDEISFAGGSDARLESDFRTTLTDLLADNHLKPMAAWARQRGLTLRSQAYQTDLGNVGSDDVPRLARTIAKPDVETLGFGDPGGSGIGSSPLRLRPNTPATRLIQDKYRQVVSGAHLSGHDEVSARTPSDGSAASSAVHLAPAMLPRDH